MQKTWRNQKKGKNITNNNINQCHLGKATEKVGTLIYVEEAGINHKVAKLKRKLYNIIGLSFLRK